LGAWVNGLAFIPFSLLQAQGKPDVVAKLHTTEVLPYLGTLWVLVHKMGLVGAAIAWALRVIVDGIVLAWLTRLPIYKLFSAAPALIGMLIGLTLGIAMEGLPLIAFIAAGTLLALSIGATGLLTQPHLRETVMLPVNRLIHRSGVAGKSAP